MVELPAQFRPRETALQPGETYYRMAQYYRCEHCNHDNSQRLQLGFDSAFCSNCNHPLVIQIRSRLLAKLVGRKKHETYLPEMLRIKKDIREVTELEEE